MRKILELAIGIIALMQATPALAGIYVEFPENNYTYFTYPQLFLLLLLLVILVWLLDADSTTPEPTVEHFDVAPVSTIEEIEQEAARLRAQRRLLDAETELKESQFKAAMKAGELREIAELLKSSAEPPNNRSM